MNPLYRKLVLLFLGAPLALAGTAFGLDWLFVVGVVILVIALSLPTREGQTLGEKLSDISSGFPLLGSSRRRSPDDPTGEGTDRD